MKKPEAPRLKVFGVTALMVFMVFFFLGIPVQADSGYSGRFDALIDSIAKNYGLESSLIHSIIRTESNYDPNAVSSKGAVGLMQLMPETAEKYGVEDLYDPRQNILGGVKYLSDLINSFGRKTDYVLAAYNAGHNAIKKYGGIPPFPETRRFIQKVKTTYPHSTIRSRTRIYKYYDDSGRVVFTNSRLLYSQNKRRNQKNEK
ncbi:MAG: lytic transglycosylase domain-containing protein [Candidatus Aminicenantes bacterium]|nr:MAG: lytic transglycosylase domain-containing protein [Candidatus Aminicenantes bacterium]